MKRFGPQICAEHEHAPVPVGMPCVWCDEPIAEDDSGFLIPHHDEDGLQDRPYHIECFIRSIIGSVGHQLHQCSCYGGTLEDPPDTTRRQAALLAYDLYCQHERLIQRYRQAGSL